MKQKRLIAYVLTIGFTLFLAACQTGGSAAQASRRDVLFVCACGPDCKCTSVSVHSGKCSCRKALQQAHMVKVEGDTALLCMCEPGCKCTLDSKDPSKCGCGKPIRKVSLKGSGLYFCNCGGACTCNTVSDKPGQCKCGMALKRVD